jgi:hypothetical protein
MFLVAVSLGFAAGPKRPVGMEASPQHRPATRQDSR